MATSVQKVLDARVTGHQFEIPQHPRVDTLLVENVLKERPAKVFCVGMDSMPLEALRLMAEHDIGAVLVMEGGRIKGVFSERDYARHAARFGRQATEVPVGEAMTPCDVSVTLADSAETCLRLMSERRLRHIPVQGASGPLALLDVDDIHAEMAAHHAKVFKANELDQQLLFLPGTYSC